jgi:hypothetical protein
LFSCRVYAVPLPGNSCHWIKNGMPFLILEILCSADGSLVLWLSVVLSL